MSGEVLVGLDVGTSAVKGVAIAPDGEVLHTEQAAYPLSTPHPGWAEQDPEHWWRAAREVLERLQSASGTPAAIGLSGQMHGLVALDERDRVLRPAILWNDQRTAAQCEQIEATIGREELIELTGNRALTGFTAPKLLWLREHEPDVYRQIAHIALPKDYVRLRLCGEHATDASDASGTLLLDVAHRAWSDQAAGALGVGVHAPGPLSVVLGTSGVVFAALERFAPDAQARAHAFCHVVPGAWHAMGVMLSAAGALSWFHDTAADGVSYDRLFEEASEWAPGVEGLLFAPYLAGERTPHADPDARGAFVGLGLRHNRGALVRAVLEGVAFGLRDCLDVVSGMGPDPDRARVSGGGTRSRLWLAIVASVLELPLERVAVDAGAAFGAALLAGVTAGVYADCAQAVAQAVRSSEAVEPVPEWVEVYRDARPRYVELYPGLGLLRGES
jgi:xylulokinase